MSTLSIVGYVSAGVLICVLICMGAGIIQSCFYQMAENRVKHRLNMTLKINGDELLKSLEKYFNKDTKD